MNRNDGTEKIISTQVAKGLQWSAIAQRYWQSMGRAALWPGATP